MATKPLAAGGNPLTAQDQADVREQIGLGTGAPTSAGLAVLTAADAAAQRTAIGAASLTTQQTAAGGTAVPALAGNVLLDAAGATVLTKSGTTTTFPGPFSLGAGNATLFANSANILQQYNGANPQGYQIFNRRTDSSNGEWGAMQWSGNTLQIGAFANGSGQGQGVEIWANGAARIVVDQSGLVRSTTALVCGLGNGLGWFGRSYMLSPADGQITLTDNGLASFNRLNFGGTTSSFPAVKRSSAILQARLADDSDFTGIQGRLRTHQNAVSEMAVATHTLTLFDAAGTAYKVLALPA